MLRQDTALGSLGQYARGMGNQPMSYSRWTNSRFYTYRTTDTYGDQDQLMIDAGNFNARVSYALVKEKPWGVARIFATTEDEVAELVDIFRQFTFDVENR
jgi:hypothetical protein